MDLLGGYNSDSSSDDGKAHESASGESSHAAANNSLVQPAKSARSDTTTQNPVNDVGNSKKTSTKGKKLLKLQAVLPQHIWNQLTKNGDADDSDDDNDGNVGTNDIRTSGTSQGRQMNQKSISNSSVTQESSGLASLLMALPKAKKQTNSGGGILGTHSTNNMEGTGATQTSKEAESSGGNDASNTDPVSTGGLSTLAGDSIAKSTAPSGLGAAFLTVTTQVTRKKKSEQDTDVVHIHQPEKVNKEKVNVSTYQEDSNPVQLPQPMLVTPLQTTARPRPAAPTVRPVTAPMVPYPTSSAPPSAYHTGMNSHTSTAIDYPTLSHPHGQANDNNSLPMSKKSRRRQMEAMLRAGNIQNIESDIHLEGVAPNAHAPNQGLSALEQQQRQLLASRPNGMVRMVPTTSYNVATGSMTVSTSISGKQRGKNQLSALLANAAALEASRMSEASLFTNPGADGGAQQGRLRRANAKRKYGW